MCDRPGALRRAGLLFASTLAAGGRFGPRRYEHRPDTLRIDCDLAAKGCAVRSIIDWRAQNPDRGTVVRGSSEFEIRIGFGEASPRVTHERGRVIARQASSPIRQASAALR